MNTLAMPSSCAMALKEWATVLEAMHRGEQLLLIRKGGLIEPGSGFEVAAPCFVFYPTFEHQAVNYLRSPFQGYFDAALARRAPGGHVRIDLVGIAVSSAAVHDPATIDRLSPFHIYNHAFLEQRLKWQPEQPLAVVVVRAFELASPQVVPMVPRYAGCTSWVELDLPISLEGARPLVEDAIFQQRAQAISALLPSA